MSRLRLVLVALSVTIGVSSCGGNSRAATPSGPTGSSTSTTSTTSGASTASTSSGTSPSPCAGSAAPARYRHVVVIVMENHDSTDVLGSAAAPFERELAGGCATATHYGSVGSPSLPNYLGATSGQTFGIHDDAAPAAHPLDADNVFRQVRAAGGTARTYAESMPGPCSQQSAGRYAVKHNPAAYYRGGDDRAACQQDDLPLGTPGDGPLATELAAGSLPAFTMIVPDLCNDTHDCPVATGDAWLRRWVTSITDSGDYRTGSTVVFVVWDEPTPMPFIAVAPAIRPGVKVDAAVDHYSLLRTAEELLGLPLLGQAARATSLAPSLGI
jgi:phospholipase C